MTKKIPWLLAVCLGACGCAYMLGLYYDVRVTLVQSNAGTVTNSRGEAYALQREKKVKSYGCGDGYFTDTLYTRYSLVSSAGQDILRKNYRENIAANMFLGQDDSLVLVFENHRRTDIFVLAYPYTKAEKIPDMRQALARGEDMIRVYALRRLAMDVFNRMDFYPGGDEKNKKLAREFYQRLGDEAVTALEILSAAAPCCAGRDCHSSNFPIEVSNLQSILGASPGILYCRNLQPGLTLGLSADKDAYQAGDQVALTLRWHNAGESRVELAFKESDVLRRMVRLTDGKDKAFIVRPVQVEDDVEHRVPLEPGGVYEYRLTGEIRREDLEEPYLKEIQQRGGNLILRFQGAVLSRMPVLLKEPDTIYAKAQYAGSLCSNPIWFKISEP